MGKESRGEKNVQKVKAGGRKAIDTQQPPQVAGNAILVARESRDTHAAAQRIRNDRNTERAVKTHTGPLKTLQQGPPAKHLLILFGLFENRSNTSVAMFIPRPCYVFLFEEIIIVFILGSSLKDKISNNNNIWSVFC